MKESIFDLIRDEPKRAKTKKNERGLASLISIQKTQWPYDPHCTDRPIDMVRHFKSKPRPRLWPQPRQDRTPRRTNVFRPTIFRQHSYRQVHNSDNDSGQISSFRRQEPLDVNCFPPWSTTFHCGIPFPCQGSPESGALTRKKQVLGHRVHVFRGIC